MMLEQIGFFLLDFLALTVMVSKIYGPVTEKKVWPVICCGVLMLVAFLAGGYAMMTVETLAVFFLLTLRRSEFSKKLLLSFTLYTMCLSWTFIFRELSYQVIREWEKHLFLIGCHLGYCGILLLLSVLARHREEVLNLSRKTLAVMLLFPSVILACNLSFAFYLTPEMSDVQINRVVNYIGILNNAALVLLGILLFYIYGAMEKKQIEMKKQIQLEQQLAMQTKHYREMERMQNGIRKVRHDMKNNLDMIAYYLEQEDMDSITKLLKGFSARIDETDKVINTGNPSIDGILNIKAAEAGEREIMMETDISVPASMKLDQEIIITALGNLLDNAIEANEKNEEGNRKIQVSLKYINQMLCIKIVNPCSENAGQNHTLSTTKEDSENHGFGIENVKECVAKAGGNLEIEQKAGIFAVQLLFYNIRVKK